MINFKELLVDPYNFGIEGITDNAVFIEFREWDEGEWYLFLGPCEDGDCLSDSISFTDEFLNSVIGAAGGRRYELHASENHHIVYFDSEEASSFYEDLKEVIS